MNTNAVYLILEDGKEFYFHSEFAGGFSYPFEVAGYLNGLKCALQKAEIRKQSICVAPLLAQMKGTCCFPDSLNDTLLFKEVPKERTVVISALKAVPFFVTLDVNKYTVAFHFNEQFEELSRLSDIVFPCFDPKSKYSGGYFTYEALSRQSDTGVVPFHEVYERTFRELIEQAIAESTR